MLTQNSASQPKPWGRLSGQNIFYHSRQPHLSVQPSYWLRAVEYLGCYPRVQNLGYPSSNILYLQRSKYQIQKKDVRQPLSHPCSHVVFQEIFVTKATQGLSQKSKTAWINKQAHTKACTSHTMNLPYHLPRGCSYIVVLKIILKATMAKPPAPRCQTGDFVMYRMKEAATVENVCDLGLGFNNYNITFLSDGSKLMKGITNSKWIMTVITFPLQCSFQCLVLNIHR